MRQKIKKISKFVFVILIIYAVVLVGGFFGVKYGLTNTAGIVHNFVVYHSVYLGYNKISNNFYKLRLG